MTDFLSSLLKGGSRKRKSARSHRSIVRQPKRAADQKRFVWQGKLHHTKSGLTKSDLTVSKSGQIVSKLKSAHGKRMMAALRREGLAAEPFRRRSRRGGAWY